MILQSVDSVLIGRSCPSSNEKRGQPYPDKEQSSRRLMMFLSSLWEQVCEFRRLIQITNILKQAHNDTAFLLNSFFLSLFLSSLLPIFLPSFFFFLSLFLANECNHIRFLYFKTNNNKCNTQKIQAIWKTKQKKLPEILPPSTPQWRALQAFMTAQHTCTHIHILFFLLWKSTFFTYALMERKSMNLEQSQLFQCRHVTSLTVYITVYYESNNRQMRRRAIPLPSKYL